jgi:hypothetical protein
MFFFERIFLCSRTNFGVDFFVFSFRLLGSVVSWFSW